MQEIYQKYAKAKYLIYSAFQVKNSNGSTIGGSNYYNLYPESEEEAKIMLEEVKKKAEEFNAKFPSKDTTYRYGYHLNQTEWWINKN